MSCIAELPHRNIRLSPPAVPRLSLWQEDHSQRDPRRLRPGPQGACAAQPASSCPGLACFSTIKAVQGVICTATPRKSRAMGGGAPAPSSLISLPSSWGSLQAGGSGDVSLLFSHFAYVIAAPGMPFLILFKNFPGGLDRPNIPSLMRPRFDPTRVRRSPEGNGTCSSYSCTGKSHSRGAWPRLQAVGLKLIVRKTGNFTFLSVHPS